jgi:hypothetical protein
MTDNYESPDSTIAAIEDQYLQEIFACETPKAVEAAVTYATYLNRLGLTAENYPVFLSMLDIENHWVVDALVGNNEPATLLSHVQPNDYIVERILAMVRRWHRGGILSKNLAVILGVLQAVYRSPREGFGLRPLTVSDINAVARHLDEAKGQDHPINRAILDLLDRLGRVGDTGDEFLDKVSVHANAVRTTFLDDRKKLEDVIPAELLTMAAERGEVAPRSQAPFTPAG